MSQSLDDGIDGVALSESGTDLQDTGDRLAVELYLPDESEPGAVSDDEIIPEDWIGDDGYVEDDSEWIDPLDLNADGIIDDAEWQAYEDTYTNEWVDPADLNGDGIIDDAEWQVYEDTYTNEWVDPADLNGDGIVDDAEWQAYEDTYTDDWISYGDPGVDDLTVYPMPDFWCGMAPGEENGPGDELINKSVQTLEVRTATDTENGEIIPIFWCGTTTGESLPDGEGSEIAVDDALPENELVDPINNELIDPINVEPFPENAIIINEMPTFTDTVIEGTAGDDQLAGGSSSDGIYGGAGDDTLSGQAGFDILMGDQGNDQLNGGADSDRLYGGDGRDTLVGSDGADTLQGGSHNDLLQGGVGNDILKGDQGNDTLSGGDGADAFILQSGFGADLITDFEDGQDRIGLVGDLTVDQLEITQLSGHTIIHQGDHMLALIQGTNASLITADDFAPVVIAF